jgi:uncharacterized metal-binding protein YceD (DUF177 family)
LNYKNFTIQFIGLKDGVHNYIFKINNEFFDLFEYSELTNGNLEAKVEFIKAPTMLTFNIHIKGLVALTCDVCVDEFEHNLDFENTIYVKFGGEYEELDLDLIVINKNDVDFNFAKLFYDLIIVNLPAKRVHPVDDQGNSTCNPKMLKRIQELLVYESNSEQDEEDENIDSRWNELKKLKNGTS